MDIEAGRVLSGRYRLVRPLGHGSQASVWVAEHLALTTQVAVKLIDPDLAKREDARERFRREATAAAQLRSAHVVQMLDHGIDGVQPFIVMELLDGEDLFERLDKRGRLTLRETSRIVTQVARALSRAHAAGIVHRDLKPENVFLVTNEDEEIVKVFDFGVAKISDPQKAVMQKTSVGQLIGTPHYMSPEQVKGTGEVDFRADLWALGVITFQCVTGHLPFDAEGVGDLLIKITIGDMPVPSKVLPGLPAAFDAWFAKACNRDANLRFESAREMSEALARAVRGAPEAPGMASIPRPKAGPLAPSAPARGSTESPFSKPSPASLPPPPSKRSEKIEAPPPPAPAPAPAAPKAAPAKQRSATEHLDADELDELIFDEEPNLNAAAKPATAEKTEGKAPHPPVSNRSSAPIPQRASGAPGEAPAAPAAEESQAKAPETPAAPIQESPPVVEAPPAPPAASSSAQPKRPAPPSEARAEAVALVTMNASGAPSAPAPPVAKVVISPALLPEAGAPSSSPPAPSAPAAPVPLAPVLSQPIPAAPAPTPVAVPMPVRPEPQAAPAQPARAGGTFGATEVPAFDAPPEFDSGSRRKRMVRVLAFGLVAAAILITWMVISSQLPPAPPAPDSAASGAPSVTETVPPPPPPVVSETPIASAVDPIKPPPSASAAPTAPKKVPGGGGKPRPPKPPDDGTIEIPTLPQE